MSNLPPSGSFPTLDQHAPWDSRAPDGDPMSIVQLMRAGALDAELAAWLWLLVEARVPIVVAAPAPVPGARTLLAALLELLPAGITQHHLRGHDEDFGWLPEAQQLGWQADGRQSARRPVAGAAPVSPLTRYLVAAELSPDLPFATWGEQARIAIRALSVGYGLGAVIRADSLQEVFDRLRRPDVRLTDDELSHLGVVLVLRAFPSDAGEVVRRIAAAHFVRPVSRDAAGHVQRLPPAVLATWEPRRDRFEHFAWGVIPELAVRAGRRAGDFEAEHAQRGELLAALAAAGIESIADVRTAVDGYRLSSARHPHNH